MGDFVRATRRPGEARQVAIYLARRAAGTELNSIAKRFGIGYTGVSRRVGELAKRILEDEQFRARVKKIQALITTYTPAPKALERVM